MNLNNAERVMLTAILVLVIAPILYLTISEKPWRDRGCSINEEIRFIEYYSGIIADKYVDKKNHSSKVILLEDGTKIHAISLNLYDYSEVGDSLEKKKNTFIVKIHKKDTVISLIQKQLCSEKGYLYYNP